MGFPSTRTSGGQHSSVPNQRQSVATSKSHIRNIGTNPPPTLFPGNTRISGFNIQRKQNGTGSTQRCQLLKRTKRMKQSGRSLLPFEQQHHPTKQRRPPQHSTHYQTCDVISNGSRIGGSLHNGTQGSLRQNRIRRNGAQATANTTTNRQRNGGSSNQW